MRAISIQIGFLAFVIATVFSSAVTSAAEVSFTAKDGVTVFADHTAAVGPTKAIVLLFHQAGTNGGEYAGIAKHLAALGYESLAVDQRSGGTAFGRHNRTVDTLGHSADFLDALADLRASVDWAATHSPSAKIIIWGSSYSSSLVFILAADDPRVAAVLSFSPGEYFDDQKLVHRAAAKVHQPVLVSSASDVGEISAAASILASVSGPVKIQLKPKQASHGSAALNGPAGPEIWRSVEPFLSAVK